LLFKRNNATDRFNNSLNIRKQTKLIMLLIIIAGFSMVVVLSIMIILGVTQKVSSGVATITNTISQITTTADEHERTAATQTTAVNETVTTMSELSTSTTQSSHQAKVALNSSSTALKEAENGYQYIEQTMQGMDDIKDKSNTINELILTLSEQTGQISVITRLVTEIASETKMLALNASVEATHAGEHGKGFAVVASEIRKLADQSKNSAERINSLVDEIQKSTNTTIIAAEQGTMTVDNGVALAQKVATAFKGITDAINSSYENMQQISLNNKQQSDATAQITQAMRSIESGALETATGISQTRMGLHNLDEATQKLHKNI